MPSQDNSIALLIDADNSPSSKIDFIITELANHGVVNIRRAYGNWRKRGLEGWMKALHEHAIQPMQQFDLVKGKNATDMALLIDAMDILYTKDVQTFAIVSSDCDFTSLARRLREDGNEVIGFGAKRTPEAFINSCTRFLYLDGDEDGEEAPRLAQLSGNQLMANTRLMNVLRSAVKAAAGDDGWARLSPVGSHIANQGPLNHRTYGFAKLSDLFAAIDLFELRSKEDGAQKFFEVKIREGKEQL
jgi:uncharacterized protein (TIGR00288 family)